MVRNVILLKTFPQMFTKLCLCIKNKHEINIAAIVEKGYREKVIIRESLCLVSSFMCSRVRCDNLIHLNYEASVPFKPRM